MKVQLSCCSHRHHYRTKKCEWASEFQKCSETYIIAKSVEQRHFNAKKMLEEKCNFFFFCKCLKRSTLHHNPYSVLAKDIVKPTTVASHTSLIM